MVTHRGIKENELFDDEKNVSLKPSILNLIPYHLTIESDIINDAVVVCMITTRNTYCSPN